MPLKSKSQLRALFAKENRGELPKGTAKRWRKETSDFSKLPEHKKTSALAAYIKVAAKLPALGFIQKMLFTPGSREAMVLRQNALRNASVAERNMLNAARPLIKTKSLGSFIDSLGPQGPRAVFIPPATFKNFVAVRSMPRDYTKFSSFMDFVKRSNVIEYATLPSGAPALPKPPPVPPSGEETESKSIERQQGENIARIRGW